MDVNKTLNFNIIPKFIIYNLKAVLKLVNNFHSCSNSCKQGKLTLALENCLLIISQLLNYRY